MRITRYDDFRQYRTGLCIIRVPTRRPFSPLLVTRQWYTRTMSRTLAARILRRDRHL